MREYDEVIALCERLQLLLRTPRQGDKEWILQVDDTYQSLSDAFDNLDLGDS